MEDREKTKEQLIEEMRVLRGRITEFEKSESKCKRAEEVLVKERNLLRTVIDDLPDYVYIKDNEGRYIVSNDAHARFLGERTPDKVVGEDGL